MKTITLEQAYAKATKGPFKVERMLNPPKAKDRRCGFVANGPENNQPLPQRIFDLRVPEGLTGFNEGKSTAALLAHAFNVLPEVVAALELDMMFHSRFFAKTSMEDFKKYGYKGSDDANEMKEFLHKMKKSALAKANQVQLPE